VLSVNDQKAELSYAYLHAVAAKAAFSCECATRHTDNGGVDAHVRIRRLLDPAAQLTDFSLDIQLKATSQELHREAGLISFSLTIDHYNKLRKTAISVPRYLVLFTLPEADEDWLTVNAESLVCRRCAHWVSLRGAPDVDQATVTVYVPEANVLTPESLIERARLASVGQVELYGP